MNLPTVAASKSDINLMETNMFDWTHDELPQPSADLFALPGFKIWNAYGRMESPVAGYVRQGERTLGEMKPQP